MNRPLELRFSKQRLLVSPLDDGLLFEIEVPTTLLSGHGWQLLAQLLLEPEHASELRAYLTERLSEKMQ
jgi:hypothetical protein